ncbi:SGNH/GDSL hydrolase family protein [Isosphaeraceae bacterium EP7]
MPQTLLILLALLAQPDGLPQDGQRIVFLGDSITNAGGFVREIEAYLVTRFPRRHVEFINLGLSSETVTGLTETDHPFPRPDVHDRLARALAQAKPDRVVAGYGMNDGIYHPFDDRRFAAYQEGIHRLIAAVQASGARLTLLTPGPFEASAIPNKVRPAGAADYSYKDPYARYDDTLARYGKWLLTQRSDSVEVIDTRSAILAQAESMRKNDPKFHLTGDAIHPGPDGQWFLASAILDAWNAPAEVDSLAIDPAAEPNSKVTRGKLGELTINPARTSVQFNWTTFVPAPPDPGLIARKQFNDRLNRQILVVRNLAAGRYSLKEGQSSLGHFTAEDLAAGVSLPSLAGLSTNRRAAEIRALLDRRERLLSAAWLAHVGHKRLLVPADHSLPESQAEAATLEAKARALAEPVALKLSLERMGD